MDSQDSYVIQFEGKYLAKGQEIAFTSNLDEAELFPNKGCAESIRAILGKALEFEVIHIRDIKD